MSTLYIRDANGNFVPVPALQGKTAYQYALDGGYTGTEAEFAEKLAQELPDPYTLPTASADVKGGMMVGDGLEADEDGRVSVAGEGVPDVLFSVTLEETVSEVNVPLTRPAKHMLVLVKPKDNSVASFFVYVYADNCKNLETGSVGMIQVVGQTNVTQNNSNHINRAISRIDCQGGLISTYWGAAPTEYITSSYAELNSPIACLNPNGISRLVIRSLVTGYEIPAGATITVIGV